MPMVPLRSSLGVTMGNGHSASYMCMNIGNGGNRLGNPQRQMGLAREIASAYNAHGSAEEQPGCHHGQWAFSIIHVHENWEWRQDLICTQLTI
jgi:hypothetical protein